MEHRFFRLQTNWFDAEGTDRGYSIVMMDLS